MIEANGLGKIVYTQKQLQARVQELGMQISRDYAGRNPLLVGVLKGVIFFMTDLLRSLSIPVTVDFMAISRYDPNTATKGPVKITKDLEESVQGRHLIFVEDVVDTGLTLSYLLKTLRAREPSSLEVCVLFDKPQHRLARVPLRYIGLTLPDRFVVGYGLDYREQYRHLPYVAELTEEQLHFK